MLRLGLRLAFGSLLISTTLFVLGSALLPSLAKIRKDQNGRSQIDCIATKSSRGGFP
jgi:hypothetical protein